ncbi:type III-B CRISPR-associated protein Cas10/Cmr2 [Heliobacterium gestii]|uniref:Type III-B CRISPR-associated protein Cas10/Cmr2 n=1 Tax=Heliomicrobium gestii TaxID=2699 RepID=A0A845LBJ7_HELGE|nr:type III-B CRISPR-associated protein Cas10/Cmr2 [Heliomicrobium gestii]MBM7865794.1 CRISPR-associated protein Cmr2 [Heliomicrobium gestii]MZP42039.1 type III-B CRISPR-associated protein Cas10/Cmr2 [Heliomicrobium gestii]
MRKQGRQLHFTLGPVQGFVAQARRTKDLWSGSFLLSYLAGQAMYAVIKAGGAILFPSVQDQDRITDPLLSAIAAFEEKSATIEGCSIGSIPNRFKAEIPPDFSPLQCEEAVLAAWRRLAQAVWDSYVCEAARSGKETEAIWKRQVEHFWDMAWVVSEEDGNDLLDRRKNWRSHVPPPEEGDKCISMGNWQEISGFVRCSERHAQDHFWAEIKEKVSDLNLRSDERLCAIAMIKRMFPEVAVQAIGWPVPLTYPSTTYLAAVHWMEDIMKTQPQQATEFATAATRKGLTVSSDKLPGNIDCLRRLVDANPRLRGFAALNGNHFFEDTLLNDRLWSDGTRMQRFELRTGLVELYKQNEGDSKPNPYYAVLLMDGDSLGGLLQGEGQGKETATVISRALARFSSNVEATVRRHNGVLLYAGGDDVLALLPLEDALGAAVELRQRYLAAFRETAFPDHKTTISASIVYAHCNAALKTVLNRAHYMLDEVAKEETGRDSLAVNVWRASGPGIQWSAPWTQIVTGPKNLIDDMVEQFVGQAGADRHFNSAFFYNMQERYEELFNQTTGDDAFKAADQAKILAAEYLKNRDREAKDIKIDELMERMDTLLKICRRFRRRVSKDASEPPEIVYSGFSADGALLVRFLAEKGVCR